MDASWLLKKAKETPSRRGRGLAAAALADRPAIVLDQAGRRGLAAVGRARRPSYDEAIRLHPGDAEAHYNRGAAFGVAGNLERAVADYTEAIRLDPKLARAYAGAAMPSTRR